MSLILDRAKKDARRRPISAPEIHDIFAVEGRAGVRSAMENALNIEREVIEPNPNQPRREFDREALRELGESMRQDGLLQPLVVRPHPSKEDRYQIVSGERRWRAAGAEYADMETLPCLVRDVSDAESRRLALVENVNREDLTPLETAHALQELKNGNARLHWNDIADMVGKTRQWVNNMVSLLDAPEPVRDMIASGDLSTSHVRAIRQLPQPEQIQVAQDAVREHLSSRALEQRVRELHPPTAAPPVDGYGREIAAPVPSSQGSGFVQAEKRQPDIVAELLTPATNYVAEAARQVESMRLGAEQKRRVRQATADLREQLERVEDVIK